MLVYIECFLDFLIQRDNAILKFLIKKKEKKGK